jgi:hypothetical protein
MTAYRRNFVPGGRFFFTVNLAERRLALLTDHVELLRGAFRETRQRHPFTIDAIGPATRRMTDAITENGDRETMGFARAQPILRADVCQRGATKKPRTMPGLPKLQSEPAQYFATAVPPQLKR